MQDFRKLNVWEKAHTLTIEIYLVSKKFPKDELFALTNQIRRASSSIGANIAEGCGRMSQKEFRYFLSIAVGSASELEYFLLLAKDLNYIAGNEYDKLNEHVNEVKRKLISLLKKNNKS
ncbi:MAG: four helix bundle protein [Bacteroidota bacterium]